MSTTLQHPDLGKLKGLTGDGTVQFRGLKYATLEDRFAAPELCTEYDSEPTDATTYGQVSKHTVPRIG